MKSTMAEGFTRATRSKKGSLQIALVAAATALACVAMLKGGMGMREALEWWGMFVGGTSGAYMISQGIADLKHK